MNDRLNRIDLVGTEADPSGKPSLLEFHITVGDDHFMLEVATPPTIRGIIERNSILPPYLCSNPIIMPFEDISDVSIVTQSLNDHPKVATPFLRRIPARPI